MLEFNISLDVISLEPCETMIASIELALRTFSIIQRVQFDQLHRTGDIINDWRLRLSSHYCTNERNNYTLKNSQQTLISELHRKSRRSAANSQKRSRKQTKLS